jgi:putative component of membrane protein insertase Oxa1/YidC/SpoIIIJ protein YidD
MFGNLLILLIRIYWKLIPEHKRNICIFNESCSKHVYRIAESQGLIKGIKAFIKRFRQCRPGYRMGYNTSLLKDEVVLKDGSVVNRDDLRADIEIF